MKTRAKKNPNLLPCGHPDTAENHSPSCGCLACDSGAAPPVEVARRERTVAKAKARAKKVHALTGLDAPCPECGAAAGSSCVRADGQSTVPHLARPWVAGGPPRAALHPGDCITGVRGLPAASVDLVVTSIPFEELFTYSGKPEDVGNNGSTVDIRAGRFALNLRFVVDALAHAMKPGTNACVHIQQLLAYKNQHGFMGRRDFRGAVIEVFTAGDGLRFVGEFVIPKDPQLAAQKLSLHSLQFKTGVSRNGCSLAPFVNDYVLIFQKPGDHPCPPKPLFDPVKNPGGWVTTDEWVRDAHGVWADVIEIDVLDGYRKPGARETQHEKHVCPLQLEVIRRCVRLYTNPVTVQPGVTVLDPFMGIGSTAYVCLGGTSPVTKNKVERPRNVVGFELKESYHRASLDYAVRALKPAAAGTPALFGPEGNAHD